MGNLGEVKKGRREKTINISINVKFKFKIQRVLCEIERYLTSNCATIKDKIAVNDKVNAKSVSRNAEALKYYSWD
jgi:hypothetical protein